VATPNSLVVVGLPCSNTVSEDADEGPNCKPTPVVGVSYDFAKREWSTPVELPVSGGSGGGPGVQAVGWDGARALFRIGDALWAADSGSGASDKIAEVGQDRGQLCVAAGSVFALSSETVYQPPVDFEGGAATDQQEVATSEDRQGALTVWRLAGGDETWSKLPAPALEDAVNGFALQCAGENIVVTNAALSETAVLDIRSAESWTSGPGVPDGPLAVWGPPVWSGSTLIYWDATGTRGAMFDPRELAWTAVTPGPASESAAWAGDNLIVTFHHSFSSADTAFSTYTPETVG
jgi:hypothetical protein